MRGPRRTLASASSLHDTALGHLRSRQISQAESLLEQLRTVHSDTVYPELLQGHLALLSRGDAGAAEALYRRCADLRRRPPSERAAVHHSLARLCRMGERWEEASSLYEAAAALEPSGELEQERLFAAGKLALLRDAPDEAIAPLTAGPAAQPEWRRHFRRELGHACGLCGDLDAAATHYAAAALPELALGDCFGALAVHHERGAPAVAAGALRSAAAAFERASEASAAPSAAAADALVRLARAREGLAALGEVDGGGGAAALFGPERAVPSAAAYAKAVAVDPTSAAAYKGLGRALLGVPRVGNLARRSPPARAGRRGGGGAARRARAHAGRGG